jgi:hypothetical protein
VSVRLTIGLALLAVGCHHATGSGKDMGHGGGGGGMADFACVGSRSKAELVPVNLVVLLDRSGSMGDGVNGDPKLKWNPVVAGLDAFFADAQSAGMQAALQFFTNPFATSQVDECNPGEYYAMAVPMTPLPDAQTFTAKIAQVMPMGNTPTLPALQGAISYAQDTQAKTTPGARTAIVLVTDGEPDFCDSSVNDVALAVAKVAATLPTYVIGVGTSATDTMALDQIAKAGATGQSIPVSVGDPVKTKADILSALQGIRGLVLSCDFAIPAPPQGMTIDFQRVNVDYTSSTSGFVQLGYDSMCMSGMGWHYDNAGSPTKVQLCSGTCQTVRQDHGGQIDVVFGCRTTGNPIQ